MIFKFLKYLQPVHYFSLKRNNASSIFPQTDDLDGNIKQQLHTDSRYRSELAIQYDLSWQAVQKGYIGDARTIETFEQLSVYDNYVFIRKYFHKAWVFYVFILRILSFRNPWREFNSWFGTRSIKQNTNLKDPIAYPNWNNFKSSLVSQNPKVCVIIPTLNRYPYLKDVLKDLEAQDYPNFEIIVVDQSEPFEESFYKNYSLDLRVEKQEEKALWLARNNAIKWSASEYLLFFDDDSRVEANWIRMHLKALDFFNADLSSGVSISKIGDETPANYAYFRISDQLDTGNVMIKKSVFEKIGLFDRQFEKQRMGDGEFGMRAYKHGFLNVSNPHAKRIHLKVDSGGLREMASWDAFRTKKWFAPRPIPSVLYFFRSYFGNPASKLALMRSIPMSIMPYQFKKNKWLKILGALVSILIFPIILIQVMRSWHLASKKLDEGPLIENLI
ncbi:MAG: glycosyltransferase [Flavobacteriaceae bacterium]|nr:glycosyltransferase [Flavobacteriaceae bacterium]